MYAYLLRLAKNWNKTDEQEKMVRPGVCEISPVSIYGEVCLGKDLKKRCLLVILLQYTSSGHI